MTEGAGDLMLALHELLLRMAGQVPDAALTTARDHLAEQRLAEAAGAVVTTGVDHQIPITETDLQLLAALVPGGRTAEWPVVVSPESITLPPDLEFAPTIADSAGNTPLLLDLTADADPLDSADQAAVAAARGVPGGDALWRAWRREPTAQDRPVRVYLLLVAADPHDLPAACAQVQRALADSGVEHPQVEAFHHRSVLPRYHQLARSCSALLWAAADAHPVSVARVYDAYHPATGGQFSADRPALSDGEEMQRVLDYLDGGTILLHTEARESDPFDEGAGLVVPLSFRTDGWWIWTDAVGYFLRTYALSPDDELLAHIRVRGYLLPESDPVAEHRALARLLS
ncbi:hypothetical protein GCM10009541_35400 [Micromonospora gifhornensis]|uniref:Uncharacterized protein n=1 Tax=Micromonospora gifhornensis TaxID=84594 RepID=A0ABQ4IJM3_9ACTN|nr:hypothetical protein [Micromonospora gifhornensis]GIJ18098.1 hypothetical protein Vgi01_47820 [Micromonospora gifhornensis]